MPGIHCGVMPVGGVASEDLPEFLIQRGHSKQMLCGAFFWYAQGFFIQN
jgi:hypothetical protein